jgi:hypothetical protein
MSARDWIKQFTAAFSAGNTSKMGSLIDGLPGIFPTSSKNELLEIYGLLREAQKEAIFKREKARASMKKLEEHKNYLQSQFTQNHHFDLRG